MKRAGRPYAARRAGARFTRETISKHLRFYLATLLPYDFVA
jgi:hypothetical protein